MAKVPSLLVDKTLDVYLEQLLKAANIASMPEDYKRSYKERLGLEVNRRIGIKVMDELEKEDLQEFEKLLEKEPGPEEIQKFIFTRVPNLEEVVKKALDDFASEFMTAAKR